MVSLAARQPNWSRNVMAEEQKTFQLRYVGPRFEGTRLPLDVVGDLPAFRDLLVAYAKESWFALNRDRQRLPKGFDKSISFDLVALEEGSAMPKLDWNRDVVQANLPGFADELESLVDQAYDSFLDVIDGAANDDFPKALSSEQIRALNKLGSGLRNNEKIEFVGSLGRGGKVVYLDTAVRRKLITHVHETYESRFESTGRLTGVHEAGELSVLTDEYGELRLQVDSERINEFDGNIGSEAQFSIDIRLDSHDNYKGVARVYDVDLIDAKLAEDLEKCRRRVVELRTLQSGWHDGEGEAITAGAMNAATALLAKRPNLASAYRVFPTLAGGIVFEFETGGWDLSVELDPDGRPELYGVKLDGPDEVEPVSFDDLGERFFTSLDERTGRGN